MKLIALKDAYKDQATIKGLDKVKTFAFDNLSAVNDPDQDVRILLLKPPIARRLTGEDNEQEEDYLIYNIEYFLFDVMNDTIGEAMADLWESISDDVTAINKGIVNDNTDIIKIVSDITLEPGNHEHNAVLIGYRCLYDLRVFDCLNP